MKKLFSIALILLIFFGFSPSTKAQDINIVGNAGILMDQNTQEILFEKNSNERMYPASTTKIMTALVALEYGNLEDIIKVGQEIEWIATDSSKADLFIGQEIKLSDLLYGLMLPSGNDAANSIAVHIGKSIKKDQDLSLEEAFKTFVELMNRKAKEIGADNTHFVNPHGYHDEDHYTSPKDLAKITQKAMKYDEFKKIIKTTSFKYTYQDADGNIQEGIWVSYNELINENSKHYYPFAYGVKSGRTFKAGRCLVSSATKDDLNLISVVLKSTEEDVWSDSTQLLSYGFNTYQYVSIPKGVVIEKVKVKDAHPDSSDEINLIAGQDIQFLIKKAEESNIEKTIYLEGDIEPKDEKSSINAPVEKGEVIGKVIYILDKNKLVEEQLLAESEVRRKSIIASYWWIILLIIMLVGFFIKRKG